MSLRKLIALNRRESLKRIGFISGGLLAGPFLRRSNAVATPSETIPADEYTSLQDAVSAIGSVRRTLLLATVKTVSANLIIPDNVHLLCVDDGLIAPDSGVIVTIQGPFTALQRPIFAGSGTISFAGNTGITAISPEWWSGTDSQKIQAACDAAISTAASYGCLPVRLRRKQYTLDQTLVINASHGFQLLGAGYIGTGLFWNGAGNIPAIKLIDCRQAKLKDFWIAVLSSKTLAAAIRFVRSSAPPVTPGQCTVENVLIEKAQGTLDIGVQIGGEGTVGNNDFHSFHKVEVAGANVAGFSQEWSQVYSIHYKDCTVIQSAIGLRTSTSGDFAGGTFFWEGGEIAGSTNVDFDLGNLSGPCSIRGFTSESSKRLLRTGGISGNAFPLEITDSRIGFVTSENPLPVDGVVVDVKQAGPIIIRNCVFHGVYTDTFYFKWTPGDGVDVKGRAFTLEDNMFVRSNVSDFTGLFAAGSRYPTRISENWINYDTAKTKMIEPVFRHDGPTQFTLPTQRSSRTVTFATPFTPDLAVSETDIMGCGTNTTLTIRVPANAKAGHIWRLIFSSSSDSGINVTFTTGVGGFVYNGMNPINFAGEGFSHVIVFYFNGLFWYEIERRTNLAQL